MAARDVARRLGRYEIAGHLGDGGMAEIFLARLVGPSSFVRPVVVKRILPHLARDAEFITMFLDEARLLARVRHPKVAQIEDFVQDGEDLFLVMEYVEGESLGALLKRLAALGERLEPWLAAHIVAEACSALHAAHELRDGDGALVNLVHRDVSPQNVMVTYQGSVKLLDFGIATTLDRAARTETGRVKGKHEYMSPEQCRGEAVDRRSDIFALGVLLYELSTGKRLFRRESPLLTYQAICDMPIPSPRASDDAYPEELDRIVRKALARDARERYATARDLRRDLIAEGRSLSGAVSEEDLLSDRMRVWFAERSAEKRAMLTGMPGGEGDTVARTVPTAAGAPLRRGTAKAVLVAVALITAGAAVAWRGRTSNDAAGSAVSSTPNAPPTVSSPSAVPSERPAPYVDTRATAEVRESALTVPTASRRTGTPTSRARARAAVPEPGPVDASAPAPTTAPTSSPFQRFD